MQNRQTQTWERRNGARTLGVLNKHNRFVAQQGDETSAAPGLDHAKRALERFSKVRRRTLGSQMQSALALLRKSLKVKRHDP
jgi:hypothetical protein